MYDIKPLSVRQFTEDRTIKLPRFQRKKTWSPQQNFHFVVSIFKGYPLGITIINKQMQDNKIEKWLLDGRQRRTAVAQILEDPENIYIWARKTIKFKVKDDESQLLVRLWNFIQDYLEKDDIKEFMEDLSYDQYSMLPSEEFTTLGEGKGFSKTYHYLGYLFDIIRLTHKKPNLSRVFNFSKYLENLDYIDNDKGKFVVNKLKLKVFITEYRRFLEVNTFENNVKSFETFIKRRGNVKPNQSENLRKEVHSKWSLLKNWIDTYYRIEEILDNSHIAVIELNEASSQDSQKIFNIINTGGTQLSVAEILSAKASWNIPINDPGRLANEAADVLYKELEIEYGEMVKWDYPATFVYRLRKLNVPSNIFFPPLKNSNETHLDSITLGFKILAAIFQNGIKKEDIEELSKRESINWQNEIEGIISDLEFIIKTLLETEYFQFFAQWKQNVRDLLSDAVLINYLVILYKDAKQKNIFGSSVNKNKFKLNSFILLDRLIYEYVSKYWRGSSDGRIASNLREFDNSEVDILEPLESNRWLELLKEINEEYKIQGIFLKSHRDVSPLLYHFYCLSKKYAPPIPSSQYDTDHIIPQKMIEDSTIPHKRSAKHALFNLALLSPELNKKKRDKGLNHPSFNEAEKGTLAHASDIPLGQFDLFSSSSGFDKLKDFRYPLIKKAFTEDRENYLS